jgi:hypothetical protein
MSSTKCVAAMAFGRALHIQHGRVRIIAETHEDAAELFDLQAKRVADARIVKGENLSSW